MFEKVASVVKIRYNTLSNGADLCWRLLIEGEEYLVNSILIQADSFTSKDWLDTKQEYKHHITVNNCRVIIDAENNARVVPA